MKSHSTFLLLALSILSVSLFALFFLRQPEKVLPGLPEHPPFLDSGLSIETRISDLMSYMTLEEKVGQMALVEKNSITDLNDLSLYGIGALLSGAGANPAENTPAGWKKMIAEFVSSSQKSRLKIPIMYGVDAIHGHANLPGATVFPHAIGLGAIGDPEMIEMIARVTSEELRATGVTWSYSPNLDLPKDIRWGRTYEDFSDDPVLTSILGAAYVRGMQDQRVINGDTYFSVAGTLKHYLGAGAMTWGSSTNKDYTLDQGATPIDKIALRTEFLPPFKAAIDAGAMSIMAGLNTWGDTKIAGESYLLTTVLKEELGYRGFVVSDWYGVYEIPGSDYHAAVTAINAGVDMVMLPFDYEPFIKNVVRAVERKQISEDRIDDAVRRILRVKFALGLFDAPQIPPPLETIGSEKNRALARESVSRSMVLLKNNAALPITTKSSRIRIAGSAADNIGRQTGGWTVEWQGIDGNWLPGATSILSAIRTRAGGAIDIEYEPLGNFSTPSNIADIGIAVVGEAPYSEGWGDSEYPTLHPADVAAIERLRAASRKLVVIIVSGRPLMITDKINDWDALIAAWLPGSEGGGVSDVLFGDVPFTGKLPLPWPDHIGQLPIAPDGRTADGTKVLFPRSFGIVQ